MPLAKFKQWLQITIITLFAIACMLSAHPCISYANESTNAVSNNQTTQVSHDTQNKDDKKKNAIIGGVGAVVGLSVARVIKQIYDSKK